MAADPRSRLGCDAALIPLVLTRLQREALWELGSRGAGASFDPLAMSALYVMGLVEVRNEDRHVVFTDCGRSAFAALNANSADPLG